MIKPLYLKDGEIHQVGAGDVIDPGNLSGSTISRFDQSKEYQKGAIVVWAENPYHWVADATTVGFVAPDPAEAAGVVFYYSLDALQVTSTPTSGYTVPEGWSLGMPTGWAVGDTFSGWALWEAKTYLAPQTFSTSNWNGLGSASQGDPGDPGIGDPGADAKTLILSSQIQYYKYSQPVGAQDGLPSPVDQNVVFTAVTPNISGDVTWQITPAPQDVTLPYNANLLGGTGAVIDLAGESMYSKALGNESSVPGYGFIFTDPGTGNPFTGAVEDTGSQLIIPAMYYEHLAEAEDLATFGWDGKLTIKATVSADGASFSDEVNVYALAEGSDSYVFMLSNSNHTTAGGSSGFPSSLPAAGGSFKLFRGTVDVTDTAVYSVVSEDGIDASVDNTAQTYSLDTPTADDALVKFRATVDGFDFDREYTWSLSRQGTPGFSLIRGNGPPGLSDGNVGDWYLDEDVYKMYGPKLATGTVEEAWQYADYVSLVGAGVDSNNDGTVDCLISEGYLGHRELITRDFNVPADTNGLLIDSAEVDDGVTITILGDLIVGGPRGGEHSSSAGTLNVKDHGLVPGSTSHKATNAAKLNELIVQALSTYSTIYFPAGEYYLNSGLVVEHSEVYNFPLSIKGEGPGITTLRWTDDSSDSGIYVKLPPQPHEENHFFSISGMALISEEAETSVALRIEGTSQIVNSAIQNRVTPRTSVSDLLIKGLDMDAVTPSGWSHGIILDNVQVSDVENVTFIGPQAPTDPPASWQLSTTGLTYKGMGSPTDHFVSNYRAVACRYGIAAFGSVEGLNITQSTFLICTTGIDWNTGSASSEARPMLNVSDCHFDCYKYCIWADHLFQGNIHHNLFYIRTLNPAHGGDDQYSNPMSLVLGPWTAGCTVDANTFYDTEVGERGVSVRIEGSRNKIINNTFNQDPDDPVNEPKIELTHTSFQNVVHGNQIVRPHGTADIATGGNPLPFATHDTATGLEEEVVADYGPNYTWTISAAPSSFVDNELVTSADGSEAYIRFRGTVEDYGNNILLVHVESGAFQNGAVITGATSGASATITYNRILYGNNIGAATAGIAAPYVPSWHDLSGATTAQNPPEGGSPQIIWKPHEQWDQLKDQRMGTHMWFFEVDLLDVLNSKFQQDGTPPLWHPDFLSGAGNVYWGYDEDYPRLDPDYIVTNPITPDEFPTYSSTQGNILDSLDNFNVAPQISTVKISWMVSAQSFPSWSLYAFTDAAFSKPYNSVADTRGIWLAGASQHGAKTYHSGPFAASIPVIDGKLRMQFSTFADNRSTGKHWHGGSKRATSTNGGNHELRVFLDAWL